MTWRAAVALLMLLATPAAAGPRTMVSSVTHHAEHVGQCFRTRVKLVSTRLVDNGQPVPESGSAIELTDGHYNDDYDHLAGIDRSRRGDPVLLCVLHLPSHCPPGDTRGILYLGKNLRTGLAWKAHDAEHVCGGA